MTWGNRGKSKFGNTKVEHAGHWFDSQLEKAVFLSLSLRERAGEIRALSHHPGTVFLGPARAQYRPDFRFEDATTGEVQWAEAKGFETPAWRGKLKLWRVVGPGRLHIFKGTAASVKLVETVIPKQDACPTCGRTA
jgi:hypothetical protein